MNKVIIMGRLTREPDIRTINGANGETLIARYTVAVDRRRGSNGQQQADFIQCSAWGRNGEFAQKYLHKGTKVVVTGRIQTGSYQRQDGTTAYTTEVYVEEQEFAESKQSQPAQATQPAYQQAAPVQQSYQQPAPAQPVYQQPVQQQVPGGFMDIPDGIEEELPFQ